MKYWFVFKGDYDDNEHSSLDKAIKRYDNYEEMMKWLEANNWRYYPDDFSEYGEERVDYGMYRYNYCYKKIDTDAVG